MPTELALEKLSHDAEIYRIASALGLVPYPLPTIEDIIKEIEKLKKRAITKTNAISGEGPKRGVK